MSDPLQNSTVFRTTVNSNSNHSDSNGDTAYSTQERPLPSIQGYTSGCPIELSCRVQIEEERSCIEHVVTCHATTLARIGSFITSLDPTNPWGMHSCCVCDHVARKVNLLRHFVVVHINPSKGPTATCLFCGDKVDRLPGHIQTHHPREYNMSAVLVRSCKSDPEGVEIPHGCLQCCFCHEYYVKHSFRLHLYRRHHDKFGAAQDIDRPAVQAGAHSGDESYRQAGDIPRGHKLFSHSNPPQLPAHITGQVLPQLPEQTPEKSAQQSDGWSEPQSPAQYPQLLPGEITGSFPEHSRHQLIQPAGYEPELLTNSTGDLAKQDDVQSQTRIRTNNAPRLWEDTIDWDAVARDADFVVDAALAEEANRITTRT